jgi:hypothetical protein
MSSHGAFAQSREASYYLLPREGYAGFIVQMHHQHVQHVASRWIGRPEVARKQVLPFPPVAFSRHLTRSRVASEDAPDPLKCQPVREIAGVAFCWCGLAAVLFKSQSHVRLW